MKKIIFILAAFIFITLSANNLSRGVNNFSFELMKIMETDKNTVFSPYSIHKALSMTAEGAKSDTEKEMLSVLYRQQIRNPKEAQKELEDILNNNAGSKVIWQQANAIWIDNDFKTRKKFRKTLENYYLAEINSADFQNNPDETLELVNNWVKENTNNKIPSILNNINPLDRLVLCNAVYFLGNWEYPFKERATNYDTFYLSNGEGISVEFMQQTHDFDYFENNEFQVISLPYKSSSFAMMIVLPKENSLVALNNFDLITYENICNSMITSKIVTKIPKFKIEYDRELSNDLIQLGMPKAFSPDANFKNISKTADLFISIVQHKAFIEVNEKGTEAAAATAVVMKMLAAPPPRDPIEFIADHPFIYFLMDRDTKTILFTGVLQNP